MLDDIVLLEEPELEEAVRAALRYTHNLAEGSGAAPLAAAKKYGRQLAGKKIGCVMSGGKHRYPHAGSLPGYRIRPHGTVVGSGRWANAR
jgi:threonine dehydratase